MEKKVQSHENDGAKGSGFTGPTGSNSYSQLPRSSNAGLGIDAEVASGLSDSDSTPDSHMQNAGPTGDTDDKNSSNADFGIDGSISDGTVPARRKDDVVNAGPSRGDFGRSAKGGSVKVSDDSYYGSGARKAGTAAAFGTPGRGGSMELAIRGLSGNTAGPAADNSKQPAVGAQRDLDLAERGMKGSAGSGSSNKS